MDPRSAQRFARFALFAGMPIGVAMIVWSMVVATGHLPTEAVGCVIPAAFVAWGLCASSRPLVAWVPIWFGIAVAIGVSLAYYLLVTREDPHYPTRDVHVGALRRLLLIGYGYGGLLVLGGVGWVRAIRRAKRIERIPPAKAASRGR